MTDAPPRLSAPIVLVPGMGGVIPFAPRRRVPREYFPGVKAALEAAGNRVLVAQVSATAGVATRAAELRAFIEAHTSGERLHLIGHSLGGLDARYMISRLDMASRVRSLVTIGTPHRGTPFADWMCSRFSRIWQPIYRAFGVSDEAFFDLRLEACRRFNETVPDAPEVRYVSIAGQCTQPWLGYEWRLPARIVGRVEGPNDGVVSVASATWGERTEVWGGDHLNLVNWPNRHMQRAGAWKDRSSDYARLLNWLE